MAAGPVTGKSNEVSSDLLDTPVTAASTQSDECFKEPVDFRLIADVVPRRRRSLSSNSNGQQLTRSIKLEDVLVGFIIAHVNDGVAREVRPFALQGQPLVRGIRHEEVDDQLSAD